MTSEEHRNDQALGFIGLGTLPPPNPCCAPQWLLTLCALRCTCPRANVMLTVRTSSGYFKAFDDAFLSPGNVSLQVIVPTGASVQVAWVPVPGQVYVRDEEGGKVDDDPCPVPPPCVNALLQLDATVLGGVPTTVNLIPSAQFSVIPGSDAVLPEPVNPADLPAGAVVAVHDIGIFT